MTRFNKAITAILIFSIILVGWIIMDAALDSPDLPPKRKPGDYTTRPHNVPTIPNPDEPIVSGLPNFDISVVTEPPVETTLPEQPDRSVVIPPVTTPPVVTPPITTPPIATPEIPGILPPVTVPPITVIPSEGLSETICDHLPALCGTANLLDQTVDDLTDNLGTTVESVGNLL